jgi:hypothetical protein
MHRSIFLKPLLKLLVVVAVLQLQPVNQPPLLLEPVLL